jgi:hypothetical protein
MIPSLLVVRPVAVLAPAASPRMGYEKEREEKMEW